MKVLLSAYACEPNRGSEPAIGWNNAKAIAQYHTVWVFTSQCYQAAIEAELTRNPIPNLHFVYLDPFGWVYDWSQEGKRPHWDAHLHYYLWQIWAYFVARSLHQTIGFDLVHHVSYVKYCHPSFLALLPIPLIWGPVGGGESAPEIFWSDFSFRGKSYEIARSLVRWIGEHDPFVRLTARKSCFIWATTQDTANRLQDLAVGKEVQILAESGILETEISQLTESTSFNCSPARFISMARLLHWKGLHIGIRAFAQAKLDDAEYWILGDGPERERLQRLAEELGVDHQIKFWSKLPRDQALDKLNQCLALVHPSLHDSGGWVCLEAMAAGCPVICLDLGGPAEQVTAETGFKIPAISPEQSVEGVAKAMQQLAYDPNLREKMGQAGQKRVKNQYTWEAKAQIIHQTYEQVLNKLSASGC
ncbi:MAG: glycosyltransferase family 4 protein [Leptolyngbyaceae cyanobacterium]